MSSCTFTLPVQMPGVAGPPVQHTLAVRGIRIVSLCDDDEMSDSPPPAAAMDECEDDGKDADADYFETVTNIQLIAHFGAAIDSVRILTGEGSAYVIHESGAVYEWRAENNAYERHEGAYIELSDDHKYVRWDEAD